MKGNDDSHTEKKMSGSLEVVDLEYIVFRNYLPRLTFCVLYIILNLRQVYPITLFCFVFWLIC